MTLSGFTGGLRVKMKDGNDTISITGLTVARKAKLYSGEGNDSVILGNDNFSRSLQLDLARGNDTVTLTGVHVAGEAEIEGHRATRLGGLQRRYERRAA